MFAVLSMHPSYPGLRQPNKSDVSRETFPLSPVGECKKSETPRPTSKTGASTH
jgi:hypothetical protein